MSVLDRSYNFFEIQDLFLKNGSVIVATDLGNGKKYVLDEKILNEVKIPSILNYNNREYFIESLSEKVKIVVAGAGHVSYVFAQIANTIGFDVVIVDDRKEFANKERFEKATVLCDDFEKALSKDFGSNVYYVIMTRGHKDDYRALKTVIRKKSKYIGLMGSRRKVALAKNNLLEDGFNENEIKKVHMPIGIDIGAITPAEIAISIIAEIISVENKNVKDKGDGEILKHIKENSAMVTIIDKSGSAPRGTGSKMLVFEDGSIVGTIGGGALEGRAIEIGKEIAKKGGIFIKDYSLSNNEASELGMVCGGNVKIMIEGIKYE